MGEDKSDLVRVNLDLASVNRHVGQNIARSQFFLKSVMTLELPNATAKLRISNHTPVIYIRKSLEEDEEQTVANRLQATYVLLHAHVVDGRRVLLGFSASPFFGKATRQKPDEIDVSIEEVAGGQWLKMTPKEPLPDGEYGVNRMPEDKGLFENFVYDFGVEPR